MPASLPALPTYQKGRPAMTTTTTVNGAAHPASSADGVAWDLGDLYAGPDDPRIDQDLQAALKRAQAFEQAYRGKINVPEGPSPVWLAAALRELESLSEQRDRTLAYSGLLHAGKTDDPRRGALLSRTREQATAVSQASHLLRSGMDSSAGRGGPPRDRRPGPGTLPPLPRPEAGVEAALPHASRKKKFSTRRRSPAAPLSSGCLRKRLRRLRFPVEHRRARRNR